MCYLAIMTISRQTPGRVFRTWIEVNKKALEHNFYTFLGLIPAQTRLMAVIKSNAYGHGLTLIAKELASYKLRSPKDKLWFGVDSIIEALRLRREDVKNPILVLGFTLAGKIGEAAQKNITLSISNFAALEELAKTQNRPQFHLKIDTGMHRQGFLPSQVPELTGQIKRYKLNPRGIYTHFASAKDAAYPTYTLEQLAQFKEVLKKFKKAGYKNLTKHAAASGGTLLFPRAHFDMVRIGMGLYGYWPSIESQIFRRESQIKLRPILTWKTLVAEIKKIPKDSYVSYDLTEKVSRDTVIAVLPIGYWHGYDRGLSGIGKVLIKGRRAKVLGRVTMDMIIVDVTEIRGLKVGDEAVLVGKQGRRFIWADELALKIGTSPYEFLTRLNPLIYRTYV